MYTPKETYLNYIEIARAKTSAEWYKTLLLAILAGAFIALGAAAASFAAASFSGSAASAVKAAVFPVGLILVVVLGAELFTGSCLLIGPTLGRHIKLTALFKNLAIVYVGNMLGGILIALIAVYGGTQTGDIKAACIATSLSKCNMNFLEAVLRGIPCNMLVCLAVWCALSAKSASGKIVGLYLPVFAFVVCGFEHSVANAYYLTAGLLSGNGQSFNAANALINCLIPSTIGNIIGGAMIAAPLHLIHNPKN